MTDDLERISGVSPVAGVTPPRPVHPTIGREQIDLFERMGQQGHRGMDDTAVELVTTLSQDEVYRIEERLPEGETVASILRRALDYHPSAERRPGRHHPPPGRGHVDEDA